MLWIAFKLFNFDLLKQHEQQQQGGHRRCELLSNYLILTYWNSNRPTDQSKDMLWIAFKLFNFDLLKQLRLPEGYDGDRCELLSNYLILTYWNSYRRSGIRPMPGCELLSNYLILTYWNSTRGCYRLKLMLWIAFKLFNFDLLKQQQNWPGWSSTSCELLSNYLILTYWNSAKGDFPKLARVVNCFQTI